MSDGRPTIYRENDAIVLRASSAFTICDRAAYLCGAGAVREPLPRWLQEALDEGTAAEPAIDRMWVERTGIETVMKQQELDWEIGEIDGTPVLVRCHLDGGYVDDDGAVTIREYKKFRDGPAWEEWRRKGPEVHAAYPWQITAQMHCVGKLGNKEHTEYPAVEMVGGRWRDGEIVELNCRLVLMPIIPMTAMVGMGMLHARLFVEGEQGGLGGWQDRACGGGNEAMCQFSMYHDPPKVIEVDRRNGGEETQLLDVLVGQYLEARDNLKQVAADVKRWETQKKQAALGITGWMDHRDGEAKQLEHPRLGVRVTRTRYTAEEKVVPAYQVDYITVTNNKESDL